jgi:hypothetical protein
MSDVPARSHTSNVGKWDGWYANLSVSNQGPVLYANAVTYLMAAAFLADVDEVEDWGCGGGGFRRFCLSPRYIGLDGSRTPFADKIVDLCTYSSKVPGIMMRHLLEHNYDWEKILISAVRSFEQKFCLRFFLSGAKTSRDISTGLRWKLIENIPTQSQYGVEHVYFIWRQ